MAKSTFNSQYEQAMNMFKRPAGGVVPEEDELAIPAQKASPLFTEVEAAVPESWRKFSDVFGFAPPSGNDRYGPAYADEDWPDMLAAFIPAIKGGYCMDPELTEAAWHAHIDGDVCWWHGMSGTGKSSFEEQFAAYLRQPFLRFNGREDVESAALFGQLVVEEGEHGGTVWKDGLLTEGVRYGARTLIDEATCIPSGIMMGIQWLLERGGKLMLTDKPATAGERLVEPDPRFRLTFADNTRGQGDENGLFTGTGVMNTATLNRVGCTREIKYLTPDQELGVLAHKFGDRVSERVLRDIIELGGLLRRAMAEGQISLAFSLRSMESVCNKAYTYRTLGVAGIRRAFNDGYANLLPNEAEQSAALNFYQMVFGQY